LVLGHRQKSFPRSAPRLNALRSSPAPSHSPRRMEPPPLPREDEHDAEHDSSEAGALAGRWTREEHDLFLKGLELHGREWKKIAASIKTRTVVQIRTHAQVRVRAWVGAPRGGTAAANVGAFPG
jgi:SHAQKYF class myb-like DNA-binding protein